MTRMTFRQENWPLAGVFTIARGSRTNVDVVVVELEDGGHRGRGECFPAARYNESVDSVSAQLEAVRGAIEGGADKHALQALLPPGAARNALDCALWDLEAKRTGTPAWRAAGLGQLNPVNTVITLSLDTPANMAIAAAKAAHEPVLKLKIGTGDDLPRVEAVRAAAPNTTLIVDANEGLDFDTLRRLLPDLHKLGVKMVEQPLPQAEDGALEGFVSPVLLGADESIHSRAELDACSRRYGCINIKLDKTGGLTEALALAAAARARGMEVMVGCMLGTSLAMAPGVLIAQDAIFVDLDGAIWMKQDRQPSLTYTGSRITPPTPEIWG
jgi:L-alanine-DL-glutamate epimerase-like enolase superfamily enzyme